MSPATAPPVADGLVVAVNGGQNARPAADSVLTLGLSAANRYNVRPWASARVSPRGVGWTETAEFAATAGAFLALDPVVATIATMAAATMTATMGSDNRVRVM